MPKSGDRGGDCPKCENSRVLVGHGNIVIGAYCENCDVVKLVGNTECEYV